MVSISIPLYGQLLQVIGYIETRTDIKYDKKEDVVNMCKAWDDHKKLGNVSRSEIAAEYEANRAFYDNLNK